MCVCVLERAGGFFCTLADRRDECVPVCVVGGDREECVCVTVSMGEGTERERERARERERERGFVACSLSAVIRHR